MVANAVGVAAAPLLRSPETRPRGTYPPRLLREELHLPPRSRPRFWRVVVPVAGPGIAATAIYAFILAWNEFLFALTFISDESMRTLPVALQSFIGRAQTDWGAIMAASVVFTLPVVIFFLFVQHRLTQGMVSGAVKE